MKNLINKLKPVFEKASAFYKKISEIATPTIVLSVICIVVTLALSSANLLTEERISILATESQNAAMDKLIETDEFVYVSTTTSQGDVSYYEAIKDGGRIGIVLITSAKGYGGNVQVMTAVNTDGTIAAVEILDTSGETPGLGQNVTKETFYSQFAGLKKDVAVIKGGAANTQNNEINAVTGATISSKAVTSAVNQALQYAEEILAKGDES